MRPNNYKYFELDYFLHPFYRDTTSKTVSMRATRPKNHKGVIDYFAQA
jgi:hypothetical protein